MHLALPALAYRMTALIYGEQLDRFGFLLPTDIARHRLARLWRSDKRRPDGVKRVCVRVRWSFCVSLQWLGDIAPAMSAMTGAGAVPLR